MKRSEIKKGDIITYKAKIMFKGYETRKSKVVAIGRTTLLLENGDEITVF